MSELVGVEHRIYKRALSNRLAIAVGSGCSPPGFSIPEILDVLKQKFPDHKINAENPYYIWDQFIDALSEEIGKKAVVEEILRIVGDAYSGDHEHRFRFIVNT